LWQWKIPIYLSGEKFSGPLIRHYVRHNVSKYKMPKDNAEQITKGRARIRDDEKCQNKGAAKLVP
jgi:hypothetical protein